MGDKRAGGRTARTARSRSGKWVRARKAAQYLALAAFLILFLWSRQDGWPGALTNIPMRLDPLLVLAHALASRTLLAGSALALVVVIATLIFGRAWCGWICPLGTVLDLTGLGARGRQSNKLPEGWRSAKYVLLLMILTAALLGNLTLLFLDPLTILLRTLTVSAWPALDRIVSGAEALLYRAPMLAEPVSRLDGWLRPTVLPAKAAYFRDGLLFGALFAGVLALELAAPRFWCRYACPLGGLLGWLSKAAPFRRRLKEECKGCTLCTDACPTGTINASKGYSSDPSECTMCMDCLDICPRRLTTFAPRAPAPTWHEYDPTRRHALLAIGTAVTALALSRSNALARRGENTLIRPPGVLEATRDPISFSECTRCSECIRACPTAGLQPAVLDAGVAALGSPVLIPRLGYCDYSCNACGQACPVQAIPALTLEEKRLSVIGRAYIDEDRCIAWSDHTPCIVCQEMCPLPEKAIILEEAQVRAPDGASVALQLPHMVREACIGCGICEYQCPVQGEAAIRVYSAGPGSAL